MLFSCVSCFDRWTALRKETPFSNALKYFPSSIPRSQVSLIIPYHVLVHPLKSIHGLLPASQHSKALSKFLHPLSTRSRIVANIFPWPPPALSVCDDRCFTVNSFTNFSNTRYRLSSGSDENREYLFNFFYSARCCKHLWKRRSRIYQIIFRTHHHSLFYNWATYFSSQTLAIFFLLIFKRLYLTISVSVCKRLSEI